MTDKSTDRPILSLPWADLLLAERRESLGLADTEGRWYAEAFAAEMENAWNMVVVDANVERIEDLAMELAKAKAQAGIRGKSPIQIAALVDMLGRTPLREEIDTFCAEVDKRHEVLTRFAKLDAARKKKGHTIVQACEALGCSRQSWFSWAGGTEAKGARLEAIENYIGGK